MYLGIRYAQNGRAMLELFTAYVPKFEGTVVSYARGQEVVGEGDSTDNFYLIISGVFRGVKMTPDGRRQVFAFYVPGSLCGLEPDATHNLAIEAVSDATMAVLPRLSCQRWMRDSPEIGVALFDGATRALTFAVDHMMMIGRASAEERLAWFLTMLPPSQTDAGDDVVDLAMRRQDIADYLGLTIETVSRTLTALKENGVIKLLKLHRVQILRPALLARLATTDRDTLPIALKQSKPRTH